MKLKIHVLLSAFLFGTALSAQTANLPIERIPNQKARNIIFVLTDDHRYDALGFVGHPWLETPVMDKMAAQGAHLPNAFVTTSLCAPSRASIITGLYAHNHQVIDNYNPVRPDLTYFPQYLQSAGYETAFVGKWHMGGDIDTQQRGFDHWVSFKGQGIYWPDGKGTSRVVPQTHRDGFNINGKRVPQKGYITDELTDYALDWLDNRKTDKPYFLYLSHKAVHADFVAADRHLGRYKDKKMPKPPTFADTAENYEGKPMWLKNQRNSRHGVDYGYNLENFDLEDYYRRYCETLLAVDENLGRVFDWLRKTDQLESTLVVYMGDNGFQFGDHGLIDKRVAYEASIRVPLILHCPEIIQPGIQIPQVVANIDIAPTLLEAGGVRPPNHFDGESFLQLATGQSIPWRDYLLYEYYWERNYPHTPTTHSVRGDRYKYIRYHGIWDLNELYDLQEDPYETKNLIESAEHQELITNLNTRLFALLDESKGHTIPLQPDRGPTFPLRHPEHGDQGSFPKSWFEKP
jgi:N-acetylglucosamine-6-sulfatase